MNLLILGGNSPRHTQWVRDARDALAPHFNEVRFLDYKHWETSAEIADVAYEANEAGKLVADWGEYAVVAKSIGTVIVTQAHSLGLLSAKAYSFLGLPYEGLINQLTGFETDLRTLTNVTIYQNKHDPFGGTKEIAEYLSNNELTNIELTQTPGDTHEYLDFLKYVI